MVTAGYEELWLLNAGRALTSEFVVATEHRLLHGGY